LGLTGTASLLQHLADLCRMLATALTSGCIKTELNWHLRGGKQAQLRGLRAVVGVAGGVVALA
jgi:hypothetical protein